MARLLVSLTRYGDSCGCAGVSRLRRDLLPDSCWTTFAWLLLIGYLPRCRVPPLAAVGKIASSLSSDIFRASESSLSNPVCRVQ